MRDDMRASQTSIRDGYDRMDEGQSMNYVLDR